MSKDVLPDQSTVLLSVALQLGAELRLENLLPMILRYAAQTMGAERGLFALVDAHGALQKIKLHNLVWEEGKPLPVSETLIRRAIDKKSPELSDAMVDPEYSRNPSVTLNRIRFMVAQPIFVDAEVAAILYIDSQSIVPTELKTRMELLEGLAALVGTAVRSSRLYEEQRYRAQLLAQLVHDLRTPLSVVTMNAEELEDLQREEVRDIAAAADRMTHMVSGTLALSRIDAGASVDAINTVDLKVEVPNHVRQLERLAAERNVALKCYPPKVLPKVRTVLERVWIILDNLLFNAIKHTHEGTTIQVRLAERSDAGPAIALHRRSGEAAHLFRRVRPLHAAEGCQFVELAVYNVGDPIPESLLPNIFDDYTRAEDARRGQVSTGLGLSIVDQCVRYLGGAVWVDTGVETATCFKFTLPTKVAL